MRHLPIYEPKGKFIWLLVPKAATRTIKQLLFSTSSHKAAGLEENFVKWSDIDEDQYISTFVFAFVRNPWDRLYSAYKDKTKYVIGTQWAQRCYARWHNATFKQFVKDLKEMHRYYDVTNKGNNILFERHLLPQYKLTGELRYVDMLGKMENLEEDLKRLFSELGKELPKEIPQLNSTAEVRFPRLPKFGRPVAKPDDWHLDWREAYDNETRDIVTDIYKKDIDLFEYEFGD